MPATGPSPCAHLELPSVYVAEGHLALLIRPKACKTKRASDCSFTPGAGSRTVALSALDASVVLRHAVRRHSGEACRRGRLAPHRLALTVSNEERRAALDAAEKDSVLLLRDTFRRLQLPVTLNGFDGLAGRRAQLHTRKCQLNSLGLSSSVGRLNIISSRRLPLAGVTIATEKSKWRSPIEKHA